MNNPNVNTNDKYILEVKDLVKNFGDKKVLKGINIKFLRGEKVAILGANGSGKTTFLEIISRTQKATSGEVKYNFYNNRIQDAIGIQFQEGSWPPGLAAGDVLKFYQKIYPQITDESIKQLVKEFGLEEFYKSSLKRLSGGQKQRFNALLAIIHRPELILLDEVSNGLDLQLKVQIINFLKEFLTHDNRSLLIVSHSPGEVQLLCDRLIIIHDGQIFMDISVKDAVKKYKSIEILMNKYFNGEIEKEDGQ